MIEKTDQLDSLYAITKATRGATFQSVTEKINTLFSDPWVNGGEARDVSRVRLSTIHQCKGQEEDVVYLIKPSLLPHPCARKADSEWQLEQEENLKYVAVTRAKKELHWFLDE